MTSTLQNFRHKINLKTTTKQIQHILAAYLICPVDFGLQGAISKNYFSPVKYSNHAACKSSLYLNWQIKRRGAVRVLFALSARSLHNDPALSLACILPRHLKRNT